MKSAHEFAFYIDTLPTTWQQGQTAILANKILAHRLQHVIRHKLGKSLIFFDTQHSVRGILQSIDHKGVITLQLLEIIKHAPLYPKIICLIPIVKKDTLEDIIYSSVELGASEIYLVRTEKCQRNWSGAKELERLYAIMHSAAEQSKQFFLPTLHAPASLQDVLKNRTLPDQRYYADQYGVNIHPTLSEIHDKKPSAIVLTFGPEGDFTQDERYLLQSSQFIPLCLTPTILRSQQAFTLFLGMFRSIVEK